MNYKVIVVLVSICFLSGVILINHHKKRYTIVNLEKDYEVFKIKPSCENMQQKDKVDKEIYDYISSLDQKY